MRFLPTTFTGSILLHALMGTARPAPLPPLPPRVLPTASEGTPVVSSISFSPDGATLLVEGERITPEGSTTSLSLWDTVSGRHRLTIRGEGRRDWVYSGTFSPDGKMLAHGESDGEKKETVVVLRELPGGRVVHRLVALGQPFFSPDGRRLATSYQDSGGTNELLLWDIASAQVVARPRMEKGERLGWPFFGAGEVVFHSSLGSLRVLDAASGKEGEPRRIEGGVAPLWAGLPGTIVANAPDHRPRIVEMRSGKTIRTIDVDPPGTEKWFGYNVSADGRRLVRYIGVSRLAVYDAVTGKTLASFGIPGHPTAEHIWAWFSPDARYVVVRWQEHPVGNRDVVTQWCTVFTADGRLLRKERGATNIAFDTAMRSVAVVSGNNWGANDPPAVVTIHDAAEWLAGGAKKD